MKQSPLVFGLSATLFSVAGCASPGGAVREAVASAPEWYQDARIEIRGEGYPDISRVSGYRSDPGQPGRVRATRAEVSDAEALFLFDERALPPELALEEALDWTLEERKRFDGAIEDSDFLTADELAALRGVFDVRRARP